MTVFNNENFVALNELVGGDLYDEDYGGALLDIVETKQSLEEILQGSKNWIERSQAKEGTINGLRFVAFENAQSKKGEVRSSISFVDLGSCVISISVDIESDFNQYID